MAFTNLGLLICLFAYNALASSWYESLQLEREKSEHLLLNVLPAKIALRLKEKEGVIADRFDSVSVLFLDIVNFTKMSSDMAANKIVSILNEIFCHFDNLTEKHRLEKIKTIGDAYMVVSGIPDPVPDHARRIIKMAVDMLTILEHYSKNNEHKIEARIGICSGPVVAGVIGRRKFIYDLWGDTVNTASRMESNGMPNRIQVTQSTYEILRSDYEFETRGEITIKGKGKMKTYFLTRDAERSIKDSIKEVTGIDPDISRIVTLGEGQ
jgi:class 3 adenylate cyclase